MIANGPAAWIAKRSRRGCSLAKGLEGLHDRPKGYSAAADGTRKRRSSPGRKRDWPGPGPTVPLAGGALPRPTTPRAWTRVLPDGIFPPEGAPEPPAKGREAQALQKRGLHDILKATAAAHPDKRLQLWFQDEAPRRQGPGVSPVVRRGERAPGTRQIGDQWAYIFSAVRPDTGDDVTLVMTSVNAKVMDLFLAHFADTLDQDAHAVMMWTAPVGTTSAPSPSPTTSPWRCCRLTVPNSTPSSGFGSTYANASYRSASSTTPRPSSTPVAKHGSTSSQNRIVRTLCAVDHEGDFIGSLV